MTNLSPEVLEEANNIYGWHLTVGAVIERIASALQKREDRIKELEKSLDHYERDGAMIKNVPIETVNKIKELEKMLSLEIECRKEDIQKYTSKLLELEKYIDSLVNHHIHKKSLKRVDELEALNGKLVSALETIGAKSCAKCKTCEIDNIVKYTLTLAKGKE